MDYKYNKNLSVVSIDSFKWRTPLSFVTVKNRNLLDAVIRQTVNTITGDLISEEQIQNNSLRVEFNAYHIHFAITNTFGSSELVILINSKLLEGEYLDGISIVNIETIYRKIISCGVVDFTFKEFLHGICSDIDFKKDIECESVEEFNGFTLQLEQSSRLTKKQGQGVRRYSKSNNAGINWNRREGSTFAHPFLKIYHKGVESKESKNKYFFDTYLDLDKIKNRVRIEATVKNKEMANRLNIPSLQLHELIGLDQTKLNAIIKHCIEKNLEPRIPQRKPKNINKLSPSDKIIFQALTLALSQNISFDNAIDHLLALFGSDQIERNAKARQKVKIVALYEEQIKGEIYELKAIKTSSFFDQVGWV